MSEIISVGIFKERKKFSNIKEINIENLIQTFNPQKFKLKANNIHTYADPFLFEHQNDLFLFAEIQKYDASGFINGWKYKDDETWKDIGPILKQSTHLSYPFVFRDQDGAVYMLPESVESGELNLWVFDNFPRNLRKKQKLLSGWYADSNVIRHENIYYLFTTNNANELLIFFNNDLLGGTWSPHPCNPITNDPRISRNGGGVFFLGNQMIRVAQNSSERYGGGIIILSVEELSTTSYKETIQNSDFKPEIDYDWQKIGRHHLSICNYKSHNFVAIDGYASNPLLNRIIKKFTRILCS